MHPVDGRPGVARRLHREDVVVLVLEVAGLVRPQTSERGRDRRRLKTDSRDRVEVHDVRQDAPPTRQGVTILRRGRGYLSREACARSVTSTPPGLVDDALAVHLTPAGPPTRTAVASRAATAATWHAGPRPPRSGNRPAPPVRPGTCTPPEPADPRPAHRQPAPAEPEDQRSCHIRNVQSCAGARRSSSHALTVMPAGVSRPGFVGGYDALASGMIIV